MLNIHQLKYGSLQVSKSLVTDLKVSLRHVKNSFKKIKQKSHTLDLQKVVLIKADLFGVITGLLW